MKQNVDVVILINRNYRAKMMNTIFGVQMQALAVKLAALLKKGLPLYFFFKEFLE